jgi:translation initiation factor 1
MSDTCPICGKPKEICLCGEVAREQQQNINVYTTKRKYGKFVTVVEGLDPTSVNIEQIGSELKKKCASGGTVKNDVIELQGDHRATIVKKLASLGFPENSIRVQ